MISFLPNPPIVADEQSNLLLECDVALISLNWNTHDERVQWGTPARRSASYRAGGRKRKTGARARPGIFFGKTRARRIGEKQLMVSVQCRKTYYSLKQQIFRNNFSPLNVQERATMCHSMQLCVSHLVSASVWAGCASLYIRSVRVVMTGRMP